MFAVFFWKKLWTWLKHYWYWPVIVVLIIFSTAAGKVSREKMFELFSKQKENYEKELQIVKEATKEANQKKSTVFEKHKEEIKKIEKVHDIKLEDLKKEKQEELAVTIADNKDRPDQLAKEIARILSAGYHENGK